MLDPQRLGLITFPLADYKRQLTRRICDDPDATQFDPWRPAVIPEAAELQEPKDVPKRKPDLRGQGGVTEHGRRVRAYAGSSRPPHVDCAVWEGIGTAEDRKRSIAEYLRSLEVDKPLREPRRAQCQQRRRLKPRKPPTSRE